MKYLLLVSLLILGCGPSPQENTVALAKAEILKAERAMDSLATTAGFHLALLTFAADSLIKPEEGALPVIGKKALQINWGDKPGTKGISWKPTVVDASSAGDMGYTFGDWTYSTPDTTLYGNYCTIWKKATNGQWKWILDTGNNTPAPVK